MEHEQFITGHHYEDNTVPGLNQIQRRKKKIKRERYVSRREVVPTEAAYVQNSSLTLKSENFRNRDTCVNLSKREKVQPLICTPSFFLKSSSLKVFYQLFLCTGI